MVLTKQSLHSTLSSLSLSQCEHSSPSLSYTGKKNDCLLLQQSDKPECKDVLPLCSTIQQYFQLPQIFHKKKVIANTEECFYQSDEEECYCTPKSTLSNFTHLSESTQFFDADKVRESSKFNFNKDIEIKQDVSKKLCEHYNLPENTLSTSAYIQFSTVSPPTNLHKKKSKLNFFFNFWRKLPSSPNALPTHQNDNSAMECASNYNENNSLINDNSIDTDAKLPFDKKRLSCSVLLSPSITSLNSAVSTHQKNIFPTHSLAKFTFGNSSTGAVAAQQFPTISPLVLSNRSFNFYNNPLLKQQKRASSSQKFFSLSSSSSEPPFSKTTSPNLMTNSPFHSSVLANSRVAVNMMSATATALALPLALNSGFGNNHSNGATQSINGSLDGCSQSNANHSPSNNLAGLVPKTFKVRGGFEPFHLEPLKRHRGELSIYEKYRYDLSRAQLKASSRTSALLAGFAMVALVELQYVETTPKPLLITLGVVTTLLVSVHLLALMMSTCLLPYIEANGCTQDSPHIKLKFYIELSWLFSTCIGLLLFLLEVGVIFFVKFNAIGYNFAGYITTAMLVTVVIIFIVISYFIHRSRYTHLMERVNDKVVDLQKFLGEDTVMSSSAPHSIDQNMMSAPSQSENVIKGFKNV